MTEQSSQAKATSLKQRRNFTGQQDKAPDDPLIPARRFCDSDILLDASLQRQGLELDDDDFMLKPKGESRRWSRISKLALLAVLVLILVQTTLGLMNAWLQSPWLFGLYTLVLGVLGVWLLTLVYGEWQKLKHLRDVKDTQAVGQRLSVSMQMGEADAFISKLLARLPQSRGLQKFRQTAGAEHNDAEKLQLFDSLVLSERDRAARKIVRRYAAQSALLLAASPLAMLDMAIMLWRNQRMITDIAQCYGIELGYWSRIKLIRGIIVNVLYAGTSEVIADLGTQLLSLEMTGKLSARLAQGMGGGLLTARLGYQAMALCRPLAFNDKNRPKLTKVHRELLAELKDFVQGEGSTINFTQGMRNKDFTYKE